MHRTLSSRLSAVVPFALAILPLVSALPASAETYELAIGSHFRSLRSTSANAVASDELVGGTLGVARRLPILAVGRLETWATAGYVSGEIDGGLFGTMSTEIDLDQLAAGGRVRYRVNRIVALSSRLEVGAARTELRLSGNHGEVADAGWAPLATAALGAEVHGRLGRRFSLGARLEAGYTFAGAPELAPRAERDTSMITLSEHQAPIGRLDLSGRMIALTVLGQF